MPGTAGQEVPSCWDEVNVYLCAVVSCFILTCQSASARLETKRSPSPGAVRVGWDRSCCWEHAVC